MMTSQQGGDDGSTLKFVRSNIFQSGIFKPFPQDQQAQICLPNRLYVAPRQDGKIGALVSQRSGTHRDWSLSKGGLDYLKSALDQSRIVAGVVVLTDDFKTVAAAAWVIQVIENLRDQTPLVGHGQYYWVTRDFRVSYLVRPPSSAASPDEAF
jgi:hypothetical protein